MQRLKDAEKNHPSFRGHALSVTILTAVGTVRDFTLHACGSDKYYEVRDGFHPSFTSIYLPGTCMMLYFSYQ